MSPSRVKTLLLLHVLLLFMSLADVASKFAAGFDFISVGFVVCYVIVLVILGGYALGWQQVIKRMPLTTAYANRGITVVWGIFWGAVFFSEAVTPFKLLGAVMIIAGIALFSRADADIAPFSQADADAGIARQSPPPGETGPLGEAGPSGEIGPPGETGQSLSPGEAGSPGETGRPRGGSPSPEEAGRQSLSPGEVDSGETGSLAAGADGGAS